jgi:tRNA (guanosine-2'-O-)-methyltransferase
MNLDERYTKTLDFKNSLQTSGEFLLAGHKWSASELLESLKPFLTAERIERISSVMPQRTFNVAVVGEHLHDIGNISAVMRSAESFGFLPFHIIEQKEAKYKRSDRISKGSEKWLDIHKWKDTSECLRALKKSGHQIVVTTLEGSQPMHTVDFSKPTAIVLGNEKTGVSPEAIAEADIRAAIPMNGFTQSFNISVAAAIIFYHAFTDRSKKLGSSGDLTADVLKRIEAQYYLRTLDSAEEILGSILQKRQNPSNQ